MQLQNILPSKAFPLSLGCSFCCKAINNQIYEHSRKRVCEWVIGYNNNCMQQSTGEPSASVAIPSQLFISNSQALPKRSSAQVREFIRKLPTEAKWNLSSKRFTEEELFLIVQDAQQDPTFFNLLCLHLHWNECPKLITLPVKHTFPNLKVLNLGANNIESLQPLHKSNFEKLEELWLWNNRIVRVDTLRKCNFPALRRLDLGENRIAEWSKLSEINCPILRLINIEKNNLTHLQNFVKLMIGTPQELLLQFTSNPMVKVFEQVQKKGRKATNQLTYTYKNGHVAVKYH